MPGDVFEEYPFRFDFPDDPGNVGPQVALVVVAPPLPGMAEWLARVSGKDGVECATEWPSVECGEVIPYRGWREVSGPLGGDEGVSGVFLPLDKAAGVKSGLCEHEAHIQASAACAEGEPVSGT
jgi:hypothetical protein